MKKTIIALLSTIGVSFGEMTDGLVAWWTFDEDGSYTSYTGFAGGVNTGLNEKNMNLTGGVDAVGNEAPASHAEEPHKYQFVGALLSSEAAVCILACVRNEERLEPQ